MRWKDWGVMHGSAALVAMVVAAWLPAACSTVPDSTSRPPGQGGSAASPTGRGGATVASSTSVSSTTGGAAVDATATSGSAGGASSSSSTASSSSSVASSSNAASSSSSSSSATSGGLDCNWPTTVSFQKDVLPFLIASCSGTGCHVIDATSTKAAGGYDHGYDWITAAAHPSSCPETPTPFRFQVVLAVLAEVDPPSCSKCGIMPPAGSGKTPLTPCDVAALRAWLDEPYVTQLHRPDDTSPTTPYAMPPFN